MSRARRSSLLLLVLALGAAGSVGHARRAAPRGYPITAVPFSKVRLTDEFWTSRVETNRAVTIPFGFKKSEEEGRVRNFEHAARHDGIYEGKMPFDDTDVYKLIEGASYSLQSHPDPALDRYLDGLIAKIAAAQEPDGYLTTYKTIDATKSPAEWLKPGPKWDLELQGSHELYNAGHLYEAAYAHYRATGKRTLLDVALKNADLVGRTFGPGKRMTPPGHQIVETGLMKLAAATGNEQYRALARFFLDQRGNTAGHELHGEYNQDHRRVTDQSEAVGHAVRAAYMYSGMVDVAVADDDPLYRDAVQRIWDDVVSRKLYLTGAIGARHKDEAFGGAYELPNKTAYGETCASIANVYWNERLFLQSGDARYVDVLERALYNAVLAGVSLKGDTFFYPNPLESDGRYKFNQGALTRSPWFDASCCPTNIARFIPSVPDYVYAVSGTTVYVNLYVSSRAEAIAGGVPIVITQQTGYPWAGDVSLRLEPKSVHSFELRLRIPGWVRNEPLPSSLYRYADSERGSYELQVNGQRVQPTLDKGYAVVTRAWSPGDVVTLRFAMPVRRVVADERVEDDRGKVALERGPIVYAVEGVDHGGTVLDLVVADSVRFGVERRPDLLGGVTVLTGEVRDTSGRARPLTAIPYYAWSHRGPGEMAVWLRRAETRADVDLPFEDGERWWAGVISRAHLMPLRSSGAAFEANLSGDTFGNQVQPLLLSTTGRYVWSDEPFRLAIANGRVHVTAAEAAVRSGRFGTSLRDAVLEASKAYFPPAGSIPDPWLFTRPQFNTWIEFTYNQTQAHVLSYAHAIVDRGFPPGVLMIDEGWAEGYGFLEFHRGRFPDPAAMMRELHGMGFKVMLWVSPYIQADGPRFAALSHDRSRTVWLRNASSPDEPVLVRWWDGFSAITDVTSPDGIAWYQAQLRHLVDTYGVDGFKFDGGDAELFAPPALQAGALAYAKDATPNRLTEAYARLGVAFPLNEFRACWKMGGQPIAQRLRDKEHTWKDLQTLLPGMLNLGIVGYPFACPDMIGGGEYLSFENRSTIDEELIVRGAELHALMPMMQFSVAPWRVLSPEHLAITQRMAALHAQHGEEILALARAAATTGEPIARSLEYGFPHMGYEDVVDEFLLGPDLLVAPVVEHGARERRLAVPPGRWRGDDGSEIAGPVTVTIRVPLERLPYYRRVS